MDYAKYMYTYQYFILCLCLIPFIVVAEEQQSKQTDSKHTQEHKNNIEEQEHKRMAASQLYLTRMGAWITSVYFSNA
jgi:hypothetical protein